MRRNQKLTPGFTLLETLLALGIAVIITVSASLYLTNMVAGKQFQILLQELEYNTAFAENTITRFLRNSQRINAMNSSFGTHPGKIEIETGNVVNNPVIIMSTGQNLTIQRNTRAPEFLITNQFKVTQFIVNAQSINNAPQFLTGTITVQHVNRSDIQKTITFSVAKRLKDL